MTSLGIQTQTLDLQSLPTTDYAVAIIREAIVSGTLAPGTVIKQDVVAKELGISKIPVREALRRLEAENLVLFTKNRGVTVTASSISELIDIYDLRGVLETYALQRSIPLLTKIDFEEAKFILRKERLAGSDRERGICNREFHEKLIGRCGSDDCMQFVSTLLTKCDKYSRVAKVDDIEHSKSNDEHADILQACEDGDVERAVSLLQLHLLDAKNTLTNIAEQKLKSETEAEPRKY